MDRMGPLDAAFLEIEDAQPGASLAISSIAVFEGPAPDAAVFTAAIRGRLPLIWAEAVSSDGRFLFRA